MKNTILAISLFAALVASATDEWSAPLVRVANVRNGTGLSMDEITNVVASAAVTNEGAKAAAKAYTDANFLPTSGGVIYGDVFVTSGAIKNDSGIDFIDGSDVCASIGSTGADGVVVFSSSEHSLESLLTVDGSDVATSNMVEGIVAAHGGGTDANAVHYTADTGKSAAEKAQARANIGAVSSNDAVLKVTDRGGIKTAVTVGSRASGSVVGAGSVAAGYGVSAPGLYAIASGTSSVASGNYARAEGSGTSATNTLSHAEGYQARAYGVCAHADGNNCEATHNYSFVWNSGFYGAYASKGTGTFCLNPTGGTGGFYIGSSSLASLLSGAQAAAEATAANAGNLSSGTVASDRLPVATTSSRGAVKGDGSTVHIAADGTISVVGGGGGGGAIGEKVELHDGLLSYNTERLYGDTRDNSSVYYNSDYWYILVGNPIVCDGCITNIYISYDRQDTSVTTTFKLCVFSYNRETTNAVPKEVYELNGNVREIVTSIPVVAGDVLGFRADNRFKTGSPTDWDAKFETRTACDNGTMKSSYVTTPYHHSVAVQWTVAESNKQYVGTFKTPLSDLNVVLMGDSIVRHAGWMCDGEFYPQYQGRFGWGVTFKKLARPKSIYNYAVGGAKWAHNANTVYKLSDDNAVLGDSNRIYNQINRLIDNVENHGYPTPDLIIISCGVNDSGVNIETDEQVDNEFSSYMDARFNSPSATPWTCDITQYHEQDVTPYNTISKAMKFDMELLLQKFPETRIVFLSVLPVLNLENGSATYSREAIEKSRVVTRVASRYYAAPVIDIGSECGVCRMREVQTNKMLVDGVHLTEYGAKVIGKIIYERVASLLGGVNGIYGQ